MRKKLNMLEVKELIVKGILMIEEITFQSEQELSILIRELKNNKKVYYYKVLKNRILVLRWNL